MINKLKGIPIIGSILMSIISFFSTITSFLITTFIGFGGIIFIVIILIILTIIAIIAFLNSLLQPLIPFNMESVYFERYLVSKEQNYEKKFKEYYFDKCNNTRFENHNKYTGDNEACKAPYFIINNFLKKNAYHITEKNYNKNKQQLLNGATIMKVFEQLGDTYIFKNFISGKYKLTRVSNNKMKLVSENETYTDLYNPFTNFAGDSIVFYNSGKNNGTFKFDSFGDKKDKKLKYNKYRYFNNNIFNENSEKNILEKKNKDKNIINVPISGMDHKIKAYANKKMDNEEKQDFIKEYNEKYAENISIFKENIKKSYKKMYKNGNIKNKNNEIYSCSSDIIEVPYFIKYKEEEEKREKYVTKNLVCFKFKNVYVDEELENEIGGQNHLGKFYDSDIELNVLNINKIRRILKRNKHEDLYKNFSRKYKDQINHNKVVNKLVNGYKLATNIGFFETDNMNFIESLVPKSLDFIGNSIDNITISYEGHYKWENKDKTTHPYSHQYTYSSPYNLKEQYLSYFGGTTNSSSDVNYDGDYINENVFFNYLNKLIFLSNGKYNNQNKKLDENDKFDKEFKNSFNESKDEFLNNIDKYPQFLINFGNYEIKNMYNNYYFYKMKEYYKKHKNDGWFGGFFNDNNSNKLTLDFLQNKKFKKEIDDMRYNGSNIYFKNNIDLSRHNIVNETQEIGINPMIVFYKTNETADNQKMDTEESINKYIKTKFFNFSGTVIKDVRDRIGNIDGILKSTYMREKIMNNNINSQGVHGLYPNKNYNEKVEKLKKYINTNNTNKKNVMIDQKIFEIVNKKADKEEDLDIDYYNTVVDVLDIYKKSIKTRDNGEKYSPLYSNNGDLISLENLAKYLFNKQSDVTYYKYNWMGDAWQGFMCTVGSQGACETIDKTNEIRAKQNMLDLAKFIYNLYKVQSNKKEINKFYKTRELNNIMLLNFVLNEEYFYYNSYYTDYSYGNEYISNNNFGKVLSINFLDERRRNKYEKKVEVIEKVDLINKRLIKKIENIKCKKILKENGKKTTKENLKKCKKTKVAIVKYINIEGNISQVEQFLKKRQKHNPNEIMDLLVDKFVEGQCTWYVGQQYPSIDWGGHAKSWCRNAKAKGEKIVRDYKKAEKGDIVVRDWNQYGHVGVIDKVDRKEGMIKVRDMNRKQPFVKSIHRMKRNHKNFKCYIKK